MQKPIGLIEEGKNYAVTVTKILSKGIIVQIGDTEYTDFIHISKISNEFVSNINEFVKVGDKFKALAIKRGGKDTSSSEPELTLKHLNLKSLYTIETEISSIQIPDNSSEKTLDDMITAANLSLQDKMQRITSKTERHRRNPKRKSKN